MVAIALGRSLRHRILIPLLHEIEQSDGALLVYPYIDGEPVRPSGAGQPDRFRSLSLPLRASSARSSSCTCSLASSRWTSTTEA